MVEIIAITENTFKKLGSIEFVSTLKSRYTLIKRTKSKVTIANVYVNLWGLNSKIPVKNRSPNQHQSSQGTLPKKGIMTPKSYQSLTPEPAKLISKLPNGASKNKIAIKYTPVGFFKAVVLTNDFSFLT
jgi:hypothetical protein